MAGLVPAIHAFGAKCVGDFVDVAIEVSKQGVDARDKRGHDGKCGSMPSLG
jgi:hypothetical protein